MSLEYHRNTAAAKSLLVGYTLYSIGYALLHVAVGMLVIMAISSGVNLLHNPTSAVEKIGAIPIVAPLALVLIVLAGTVYLYSSAKTATEPEAYTYPHGIVGARLLILGWEIVFIVYLAYLLSAVYPNLPSDVLLAGGTLIGFLAVIIGAVRFSSFLELLERRVVGESPWGSVAKLFVLQVVPILGPLLLLIGLVGIIAIYHAASSGTPDTL